MTIETVYREATRGSARSFERATTCLPGGDTRTAAYHAPYPLTLTRGDGPYLWDIDGNRYMDCLSNYSSLVHGHRFPPIHTAVREALERGTAWPALHRYQIELAERIVGRVASVDLVRFTNSGTEAGMAAVKIARGVTGRRKVLVAASSYHGSYDGLEGGRYGRGTETVLTAEYGNAESFEEVLRQHGDTVALVVCEPVQGRGVVTPPADFLPRVLAAAHRCGALFAVDEVQTLRLAYGGAQSTSGIRPDLTIMGKIVGGGFPVGAVGGSARVMQRTDPRTPDPVILTGTFNGNIITCAAGIACLDALDSAAIDALNRRGDRLAEMIRHAARDCDIALTVKQAGSMLNLYWDLPPESGVSEDDAVGLVQLAALNEGVFFAPRGYLALNTAIDDALLERAGEGLQRAIHAAARELAQ
jgi:glutamate-1-semialdehyde 2,1-aminomutase